MSGSNLSSGMRWSAISVVGRELTRSVFTVVLARLIGPEDFGVVALAMVYVGIVGLLLDQGFSSALIQRNEIEPAMPGMVVTINLGVGAALTALTVAVAPLWASFMNSPELVMVLIALAPSLLLRAAAITPRAMLIRGMQFRTIGIADIVGAVSGGALGLATALGGGTYWSVVVQIVSTDIVVLMVLLVVRAGWLPNLRFGHLREIAGFSVRAFAAGVLMDSVSRNIDNLLVGRFQGSEALAFYGLAYRLLLLPVQLAITTVGSVLFPLFSRLSANRPALAKETARTTRALAVLALPAMALLAAAAPQLVAIIFGPEWHPAIPIVQALAIAGAIQAVYHPSTTPILLGLGHAKLNLRYAWLSTVVSTVGIVSGLPFGPFGVAVGYTAATTLMIPVEWLIRRRLLAMDLRGQLASVAPALHLALWAAGSYLAVALAIPDREPIVLAAGVSAAAALVAIVLRMVHRSLLAELLDLVKRLAGRAGTSTTSPAPTAAGATDPPPDPSPATQVDR